MMFVIDFLVFVLVSCWSSNGGLLVAARSSLKAGGAYYTKMDQQNLEVLLGSGFRLLEPRTKGGAFLGLGFWQLFTGLLLVAGLLFSCRFFLLLLWAVECSRF